MTIDKSFLDKVEALVLDGAAPKEVDGRTYSARQLIPVEPPTPDTLLVSTLGALRDYLTTGRDGVPLGETLIHIAGPAQVDVYSVLKQPWQQRHLYLRSAIARSPFPFGHFLALEDFIVALQAQFVPDETTKLIIKVVGNLRDGEVRNFSDDGMTQEVTARIGVASVDNVAVPNPVTLAPYRTFSEVDQPSSNFIFRLRSGRGLPECALFEADGGAWRLRAIENVLAWLRKELPAGVVILA